MSAHVLLNLLTSWGKEIKCEACRDKMRGLPSIYLFFATSLKTYAAISNAHLSRVCKRRKLSGSCLSTLNGFGSTQLPIFLCHIRVPTFSSQNN